MSSPKTVTVKRASGTPRHLMGDGAGRLASDDGMSGADKANFIKAMMEGVKAKAAAPKGKSKAKAAAEKPVEILRKIPAPVKVAARPSNPQSDAARELARSLEAKLADGDLDALTPEAVQALVTALAKFYSANIEAGNKFPVVSHRMAISGTDAMILCGALLKAVDLQVFELGMWQSWSGL